MALFAKLHPGRCQSHPGFALIAATIMWRLTMGAAFAKNSLGWMIFLR